jgi:uncharacterized membrane protein YesL
VKFCIQLQQKLLASSESLEKTAYKAFKQLFDPSNSLGVIILFIYFILQVCRY